MIIGSGDVARLVRMINHPEDILFFASGVSDSSCQDIKKYNREINLLLTQPREKHLVYFSSLSIYYSMSMYADHKYYMESLVRKHFKNHTIVRLGNLAESNNPNTIINFLTGRINRDENLIIRDEYRFVVSIKEFLQKISDVIKYRMPEMDIQGERLTVRQIVSRIKDGVL